MGYALLGVSLVLALAIVPARAQNLIRDTEIEETLDIMIAPLVEAAGMRPGSVEIYIVNDTSVKSQLMRSTWSRASNSGASSE